MNGDPKWQMMGHPVVLGADDGAKLCGLCDVTGETTSVLQMAKDVGFTILIDKAAEDGGGWTLAGAKCGDVSTVTGDITWTFKCKSSYHTGCKAKMKFIYRRISTTLGGHIAEGWPHDHSGPVMSITGLPPHLKGVIEGWMAKNPTKKFKALWNVMVEQHGVTPEMRDRVENYFYKGATARKQEHVARLGVSSYGCVSSWVAQNWLIERIMNHTPTPTNKYLDVAGVIGSVVQPQTNTCAVFISTPRLCLDAFALGTLGYGNGGQLHLDHTFKLLHEQVPFLVTSMPDIAQHVHLVAMGPTTSMDKDMTELCLKAQKLYIEKFVALVNKGSWAHATVEPDVEAWPADFLKAITERYMPYVDRWLMMEGYTSASGAVKPNYVYKPARAMADAAPALENAVRAAINACIEMGMCWVHVWRAIKANHHKLKKNTDARQKELYTDLAFIQALSEVLLIKPAFAKFDDKWRTKYGETVMADYILAQWADKKFQRAYGGPGEPSDNNTLESLNRVLKSDENFERTISIGMALPHALTVVHRISRDMRDIVLAPPVKKEEWVKAQNLIKMGYFKLGFKMGDDLVVPSEKCVRELPGNSTAEMRTNISVWVKEFISMMKNPGGYGKVHGANSWDFNNMMDYAFSFWILKKIKPNHPTAYALAYEGIGYTCTCPRFLHYHVCKHSLGAAMFFDKKAPPVHYSKVIVGKRGAPAGAKLQTRGHCLAIDN